MSSFPLRLPGDLKERAAAQAEAVGVSLNQYIATVLASRVRAQAEAERSFAARGTGDPGTGARHPGAGWPGQPAAARRRVGNRRPANVTAASLRCLLP